MSDSLTAILLIGFTSIPIICFLTFIYHLHRETNEELHRLLDSVIPKLVPDTPKDKFNFIPSSEINPPYKGDQIKPLKPHQRTAPRTAIITKKATIKSIEQLKLDKRTPQLAKLSPDEMSIEFNSGQES